MALVKCWDHTCRYLGIPLDYILIYQPVARVESNSVVVLDTFAFKTDHKLCCDNTQTHVKR